MPVKFQKKKKEIYCTKRIDVISHTHTWFLFVRPTFPKLLKVKPSHR